jgi:hypothetical protein
MLSLLVACGVETASPTEATETTTEDLAAPQPPVPAAVPACSTLSLPPCRGVTVGQLCSSSPHRLWCLPANDAPDGGVICACQAVSTI